MNFKFTKQNARILAPIFFTLYFLLGMFIFRQYGLSWDEPTSRDNGRISYQYVSGQNKDLFTYHDRDYGTAFELPLFAIETALGVTSSQEIYFLRHLLTFLFFFVGVIIFYNIASNRFGTALAFIGVIFFVLSPRIFADSFYNSKDIGLLSGMTISMGTLLAFSKKPSIKGAVLHAMASAFAVDVRLPGLIILPITIGLYIVDTFLLSKRRLWKSRISILFLYIFLFSGFTVLFWPYLWNNPIANFINAFSNFSHFLRLSDTVLYLGNYVPDKYVPWNYPIVWIGVTTPLLYLALFLLGVGRTFRMFTLGLRRYCKNHREDLLFLAWFFGPLLMVIGLNSALYDGWRQLYFMYPALILIALVGLESLLTYLKNQHRLMLVFVMVGIVNLISVVRFMTVNHPYQNLYFNELVGGLEQAKRQFDIDYWGLTFRQGLEYIAAHDRSTMIPIFFAHGHKRNIDMLRDEDKKRFVVLDSSRGATYILNNYRWYKDRQNYRWDPYIYETQHQIFYQVKVDNVSVMTIFRPNENVYPVQ